MFYSHRGHNTRARLSETQRARYNLFKLLLRDTVCLSFKSKNTDDYEIFPM